MRILGVDHGDRHIGLALSDPLHITAQPLTTYVLSGGEPDKKFFQDLVRNHDVGEIVVGIPVRMDGSSGSRADKTRAFGRWLEKAVERPVVFWDERLTTVQAERMLLEADVSQTPTDAGLSGVRVQFQRHFVIFQRSFVMKVGIMYIPSEYEPHRIARVGSDIPVKVLKGFLPCADVVVCLSPQLESLRVSALGYSR